MKSLLAGAFWIGVYLTLVLAPLLALLIDSEPAGTGFWWSFSLALGFAGTAMMAIQFALTARFRRASAPYGIDVVYYFHRHLAVLGFLLTLLHPIILFVLNPPFLSYLNPFDAPWFMTAGVGSLLALTLLIASSIWRKQLGIHYDGWRIWHGILAVAALVLALLHIEGVGFYIATPWRQALWIVIGASCLALFLYVRLVKPWRMRSQPYRVAEVLAERGDAWTLVVEPDGHAGFDFQPGQFAWLTLRSSPFALREHPFSFSSCPTQPRRYEFTIKELGDFSRTIRNVKPGEVVYLDAPYGAFSIDRHPAPGYVFIAGGIGIAPMMSMLRALADRGDQRPHLLIAAHSRWDRVIFREALDALRSRLRLEVVHVLEEPPEDWQGEVGYVTPAVLERHLPIDRAAYEYFVCGPQPMITAVEKGLYQLGVPMTRFHTELFDLA